MSFSLVVLAGGLGSRFNGNKQIEGIGPNGEFLMEYSIYDAIRIGCSKVIVLSNHHCIALLEKQLNYLKDQVELVFVNQYEFDPSYPSYRKRPWGTGHAVLSCKDYISNSFLLINADDFYGVQSYDKAKELILNMERDNYGLVAFELGKTLSSHGGVSRGICSLQDDVLIEIEEYIHIEREGDSAFHKSSNTFLDIQSPVSMNLWILRPSIFDILESTFEEFYKNNKGDDQIEFFLPEVINKLILNKESLIQVSKTSSDWFGITYADDLELCQRQLNIQIQNGNYPLQLKND